jgi:serine protease
MMSIVQQTTAAALVFFLFLLNSCSGGEGGGAPAATTGAISGTIRVVAGSYIDSDTDDPQATRISNNDSANAQHLQNPFIVGGFAGADSDPEDHYLVAMSRGQTLTLAVSDYTDSDLAPNSLNLEIIDTTSSVNGVISSSAALEVISIPADATYEIIVSAVSGSSKYVLTLDSSTAVAADTLSVSDGFVPGEVIIQFREPAIAGALSAPPSSTMTILDIQGGKDIFRRPHLVRMEEGGRRHDIMSALGIGRGSHRRQTSDAGQEKRINRQETLEIIRALRRRPDVAAADPNYIRWPATVPNDPRYDDQQWHYGLINLPQAWDAMAASATDLESVIVAVLDTGVYMAHPDLAANLLPDGFDFISSPIYSNDGDGIDNDPNDPGDSWNPLKSSFHGTHIAGTIGAVTDNSIGVAGIAWDGLGAQGRILPVRVLGVDGGTSADIIQGIRYAAGLANSSGRLPARRADIINLSLAGPDFSTVEQKAFTAARDAGVICIAAAGNNSNPFPYYPAAYAGVLAVSAVDADKLLTVYSNFGSTIDIAAPGGDFQQTVWSTWAYDNGTVIQPSYHNFSGTSMAAPHVAGVIALMKAVYPDLTPAELDTLLSNGSITEDLGPPGRDDEYGYGLIDARLAVLQASILAGGVQLPSVLSINPNTLYFGSTLTDLTVAASNTGGGELQITGFETDPQGQWLSVTEKAVNINSLGTYTITVNRTGLPDGFYSGTVTFLTNNGDDAQVSIAMIVAPGAQETGNAGLHHIQLLDGVTGAVIAATTASPAAGSYTFSFSGVPPGTYSVLAGTDSDNDGDICQPGEACAGPVTVHFSGIGISSVNLTTSFLGNIPSSATP